MKAIEQNRVISHAILNLCFDFYFCNVHVACRVSPPVSVGTYLPFKFLFYRSAVISFQMLPKILNGYSSKSSSENHWLLEWAVKELRMMNIFFSNLEEYVESWQKAVVDGDDSVAIYQRDQHILARLDFLTALYSNELSPDHFRELLVTADIYLSLLYLCLE